jgi:hypothetical protein
MITGSEALITRSEAIVMMHFFMVQVPAKEPSQIDLKTTPSP